MDNLEKQKTPSSTIVDMLNNYAVDNQLCLTTVAFVPKSIADIIQTKIIKPLKNIEPSHYYYPENSLHLTIKNIRTVHSPPLFTQKNITKVEKSFSKIIPGYKKFSFQLKGLLKLPTSLALRAYCDETVKKLIKNLDETLNIIGVPDNKKYMSNDVYWGNITLCRYTKNPSKNFLSIADELKNEFIGELIIQKIYLITTNSVCHPSKTKIINTYSLKS